MQEQDVRVPLQQVADLVAIGRPLPFNVLDLQGRLLLSIGHVVNGEHQLESLIDRGAWAERDAVRAVRQARGEAPPEREKVQHRETLFDRWEHGTWELDRLLRAVEKGQASEAALREAADRHVALVDREVDVALFAAMRQDDGRFALYPETHAIHSATLCLLAARALGWPAERALALVRAALTMNASIRELQAEMAEQGDPPTPGQFEKIRSHPERSAKLLEACGVADAAWLALVRAHHEQAGGGGYPTGTPEVTDDARLLRAADVFMAKVSPRARRPAIAPVTAARELYQQEKGSPVAAALIKALGVHPPGSLVQLASGEVGVVARRAGGASRGPSVATLTDRHGKAVPDTRLRDTSEAQFAIKGPVAAGGSVKRVQPERVFGLLEP